MVNHPRRSKRRQPEAFSFTPIQPDRLDDLVDNLRQRLDAGDTGFANHTMMVPELLAVLAELRASRAPAGWGMVQS